jgi:hypothetical protein
MKSTNFKWKNHFHSWTTVAFTCVSLIPCSRIAKSTGKSFQELASLECIRTQCNSEGKVAKYSRFFRPLRTTTTCICASLSAKPWLLLSQLITLFVEKREKMYEGRSSKEAIFRNFPHPLPVISIGVFFQREWITERWRTLFIRCPQFKKPCSSNKKQN